MRTATVAQELMPLQHVAATQSAGRLEEKGLGRFVRLFVLDESCSKSERCTAASAAKKQNLRAGVCMFNSRRI